LATWAARGGLKQATLRSASHGLGRVHLERSVFAVLANPR
jgi:hypothetical protein